MIASKPTHIPQTRILAVIPARGGSKGVPGKNIREVAGKPLIAYSIESALAVKELFESVVVSTDDENIATIARKYGASVPFMRPSHLASDTAATVPVIQHAVSFMEEYLGNRFDWICLLQPTAPLRNADDIRAARQHAMDNTPCDSVISVARALATHPILMKRIENNQLVPFSTPEIEGTRRQDYSPHAYIRNGAIYFTRRDVVMNQSSLWGERIVPYIMPDDRSANVDSEIDLKVAELLLKERRA